MAAIPSSRSIIQRLFVLLYKTRALHSIAVLTLTQDCTS